MSEKEKAIQLLDKVPEYKIECIVAYIEGVIAGNSYEPNDTTIAAFQEGDTMLMLGTGKRYKGTDELFADLFRNEFNEEVYRKVSDGTGG